MHDTPKVWKAAEVGKGLAKGLRVPLDKMDLHLGRTKKTLIHPEGEKGPY